MKIIPVLNIQQFEQHVSMSDFYSNDLSSHLEKNKDLFHKPHKHDFFLCVIFSKGSGVHEVDFNRYIVVPGAVYFLRPGQTHYWKFDTQPQGYIFFHTKGFYETFFSISKLEQFPFYFSHKNTPSLNLSLSATIAITSKFKSLNDEYHKNLPYKKQKLSSLVNMIYIDLARYYSTIESDQYNISSTYITILRALEKTIEIHYKTQKSAKFYADELNITPKHLNRVIKTTLGKTTTDLITERVILESKRLIVHSDNALSAISDILGYDDYAYFSRVFKLKTNTTPLEFKKSYQSK